MSIDVSIVGGSGMAAGELLRLLSLHPDARLRCVVSASKANERVSDVHAGCEQYGDTRFSPSLSGESDVLFLCLPHGEAARYLSSLRLPARTLVIDLSRDHRMLREEQGWLYALPEAARERIRHARDRGLKLSNPGCFATAIQIGLLPLFAGGQVRGDVHSTAITGSTGAGAGQRPTLHHSWRHDNIQVYDAFRHSHLAEMHANLSGVGGNGPWKHYFIPHRGPFTRGIIATSYTAFDGSADDARAIYRDYYEGHPFVAVRDEDPDLKQVVNTNRCVVSVDVRDGMCIAGTVIDNLVKGAAGQALQNMNLAFGLDEDRGLRLKASVY